MQPPTDMIPEPRSVRIKKEDIQKHGATPGCPACRAILGNKTWRAGHNVECRIRLEKAMMDFGRTILIMIRRRKNSLKQLNLNLNMKLTMLWSRNLNPLLDRDHAALTMTGDAVTKPYKAYTALFGPLGAV